MINDDILMSKCFTLARKGVGKVAPNPLVGAILLKNGEIIGEGYHPYFGGPHAEVEAISDAEARGHDVSGAILFCNLAPCCHHHKKTPPCTDLIIKKKIAELVIGSDDENPAVYGKSLSLMKEKGINVRFGVREKEAKALNETFFHFIRTGRPFIHLKWAQSLDGVLSLKNGNSKWITAPETRPEVMRVRQLNQAICVGKNTLKHDDPSLTVRLDEVHCPQRFVVGSAEGLGSSFKVFSDKWSYRTTLLSPKGSKAVDFCRQEFLGEKELIGATQLLNYWGKIGVSSVLIEGGSLLLSQFLKEGLFERLSVYIAPILLGDGSRVLDSLTLSTLDNALLRNNRGEFRALSSRGDGVFEWPSAHLFVGP